MHDWPETDDGWNALSREQILALYGGATPRLLVDVSDSNLLKCVPSLDYVLHDLEENFRAVGFTHVARTRYDFLDPVACGARPQPPRATPTCREFRRRSQKGGT